MPIPFMEKTNDRVLEFFKNMSMNPVYKGWALLGLGLVALIFSLVVRKKGEPFNLGWLVFTLLAVFLMLYGGYILAFQPQWWIFIKE